MTNSKISCKKQTLAGYFFQLNLYLLRDLGNHYPDHFIFQDLDDWIGHFTKEGRHLEFLHTILIEINCPLPITHVCSCTVRFLSICSSSTTTYLYKNVFEIIYYLLYFRGVWCVLFNWHLEGHVVHTFIVNLTIPYGKFQIFGCQNFWKLGVCMYVRIL